jgi:phosphate starvation-inducible protein PhoH
MDAYMHGDIPQEDKTYLRKVYDAVCNVMDLL